MWNDRRRCLRLGVAVACGGPGVLTLATAAPAATSQAGGWRVLQCLDPDPDQQEHVRDYAAGLQLALQSARRNGSLVQAVQMVCDGSAAAVAQVQRRLADDPGLLALAGCTTERASLGCIRHLGEARVAVAQLAPWLPDPRSDTLPGITNVFASREQQLVQAVANLKTLGLAQLGVVYESQATRRFLEPSITAALQAAQIRAPSWAPAAVSSIEGMVQGLPADAPAVLAFAGGALELSRFMAALGQRSSSRLVISLTTVDLGLMQQLGAGRTQSLLMAQVVPNPTREALPVVRQFRQAHAQLLDDTPTPSALAGYLAGRYVLRLADRLPGAPTRQQVLDEAARRLPVDLDGYDISFNPGSNRGSRFVSLQMLTREGRLIG